MTGIGTYHHPRVPPLVQKGISKEFDTMHRPIAAACLMGALVAISGGPVAAADPAPATPFPPADLLAARSVCEEKGGTVQVREAMFGTNDDPSAWLDLGRSVELCKFTADDGSRIYVDTLTLAAEGPTLASVAYLSKVPMPEFDASMGNPATAYCQSLGASSSYGDAGAGGGWVLTSDPDDQVAVMCVFPDGSMIDEWGLAYHSDGTVRGADLALQFVYQPADGLPPIF
jgi:putative hemolysin